MLGKFSSMFHTGSGTKGKIEYNKEKKIVLEEFTSLTDEFTMVTDFLTKSLPLKILLPFKGTCLKILKGDRYFAFVSREGRLALIDSTEQIILKDEKVSESSIWTLELSPDEKHIYIGGQDKVIKKFSIDSLKLEQTFVGHTGEINSIIVDLQERWMVSASDDGNVRLWGLNNSGIQDKILFSHSNIVFAMDVSKNNVYCISGSKDFTAIVYEFGWEGGNECGRIIKRLQANSVIWAVKISPLNNFVALGDQNGEILLFAFNTWELIKNFKEDNRIRSLCISNDENLLISAGQDNKVIIWHLNQARKPLRMSEHTDMIKSAILTHDEQFIVSMADDRQVIRWKIPFFEEKSSDRKSHNIIELVGIGSDFVGITESKLIVWNSRCEIINTLDLPSYLTQYRAVTDDNTLFILNQTGERNGKILYTIYEYDLNQLVQVKEYKQIAAGEIKSLCVSLDKKYLCIGELYKITTFFIQEDMKPYNSQIYHDWNVDKMTITPNNLYVFSGGFTDSYGSSISIKMIDIFKMADTSEKNVICEIADFGHESIMDMTCTRDSTKLLILTDKNLIIWSVFSKSMLKSVDLEYSYDKISKSKLYPYFYLKSSNTLDIWSFINFNLITKLEYSDLKDFALMSEEQRMVICFEGGVECFEAPMFSKHVKLVGNGVQTKQNVFLAYVKDIIAGKDVVYNDDFKNWLIMPFMFNIQHIYAYYSYDDCLRYALYPGQKVIDSKPNEEGIFPTYPADAAYIKSAKGHTPLSVSISQEYTECAKIILKALRRRWLSDPFSLIYISDCLIELNNFGLDGLHKIYEFGLRRSVVRNLPSFCKNISLPIIALTDNIETNPSAMLGPKADTSDGSALAFEQTCFKINMSLGSSEGIDFLESLIECKNERIFETQLVRLILEEKWKNARYIMYGQALLYVSFIVTLAYYSTLSLGNEKFLIVPTVINGGLLLYEIYQIFAGGLDYFKDLWNWVDLIRSSLFFIYVGLLWGNGISDSTDFLAIIILVTWIRGVTYFRIFGPTRYLINLLFEVFKDIPSFLVIFFYTILAFSFIFYSLNTEIDSKYYVTFVETYSTTLGNSNTGGYDKLHWLFYLLITLFNFIIMLNLLISILSDTYSRVKDNQLIADGQELASMVMEVEMMLFWRSKMNEKQFIHVCRDESKEDLSTTKVVSSKFKLINRRFDQYERSIEDSYTKIDDLKNQAEARNQAIATMMKGMRERLKI